MKRNSRRFPENFMFQLTAEEVDSLWSQTVTLNEGRMDMHDENTIVVMSTLRKLLKDSATKKPPPPWKKIGFPTE